MRNLLLFSGFVLVFLGCSHSGDHSSSSDMKSGNVDSYELLFSNSEVFEREFPGFKIIKNELTECLIFPLSGGVISKTKTIPLPKFALKIIHGIDRLLIALFPKVFALGMRVVLEKKS